MKLIVGLGNPGRFYSDSRHNIGFSVVKALARTYRTTLKKDTNTFSLSGKARIAGHTVLLILPLTFMNLSGLAVGALVKKYKINPNNLLVICDDLDLEFGRFKIKSSGSSGGHRGLESIIESLGNREFCRLRIGIGRPGREADVATYVLSTFSRKDKEQMKESIEKAVLCCRFWIEEGMDKAMNVFNKRRNNE